MGFRRLVRLLSRRRRLHRRVAGARRLACCRAPDLALSLSYAADDGGRDARRDRAHADGERCLTALARVAPADRADIACLHRAPPRVSLAAAAGRADGSRPPRGPSAAQIASARLWPAQEYTRVIFESATPIEHQLVVLRQSRPRSCSTSRASSARRELARASRRACRRPIRTSRRIRVGPARRTDSCASCSTSRPTVQAAGVRAEAGRRVRASAGDRPVSARRRSIR